LKVVVSELDIDGARGCRRRAAFRDELLRSTCTRRPPGRCRRGKRVRGIIQAVAENSDIIDRVSFWNLHDGRASITSLAAGQPPAVVRSDRRPKPAFDAVMSAAKAMPGHTAIERAMRIRGSLASN
jgi:hypothetical protein